MYVFYVVQHRNSTKYSQKLNRTIVAIFKLCGTHVLAANCAGRYCVHRQLCVVVSAQLSQSRDEQTEGRTDRQQRCNIRLF